MWRKAGDRTACVGHDEVMALHIVTVDPHDESAMREYQRVYEEAIFALDQHAVPHSLAETRGLLVSNSSEFRYDALAAVEETPRTVHGDGRFAVCCQPTQGQR